MTAGAEIHVRYLCKMALVKKNDNDHLRLRHYKVYKHHMNKRDNEGK